eukprot:TRINITY_DN13753_c0_g2_i1.p1 TRINITY_DN13753_c0_g2~~TRINITY_DN13753_c0_g2_i1.p1  ORF type:complete len:444 (+),score=68.55 TRINITY_DN13753_c0_g2_i1:109-1440(+)
MGEGEINVYDTAYIVGCTGLVLFMTPGLALFYGGLVREKAATDMMLQNFAALGILSITWYMFGFSLSFGKGEYIGDINDFVLFRNVNKFEPWPALTISQELFAVFQMMFAIITPILMTGTFADRMRYLPYLLFLVLWSLFVYYPWCHQIWGGGHFQQDGTWDFAGGIVVHTTAGWSALATALALGPRQCKTQEKDIPEPHNLPIVLTGTGILWFGWFGFNGGSAMAINETATTAMTNSHMAAAMAMCVWGAIDWAVQGKPKLVPLCIACVAGLVVVTPSCGYIEPRDALVVGAWGGSVCYGAVYLLNKLGVDDALDVWGVHGVGGATGTILIGILADGPECLEKEAPAYCVFPHTVAATWEQLWIQTRTTVACILYSFAVTFVIVKLMMICMPVRPEDKHFDNLDEHLHGEPAYQFAGVDQDREAIEALPGTSSRTLQAVRTP